MQIFTQLPQLYQSPVGTINPQVRWNGIGFRAAPAPPPGLASPTKFYWPRTVDFIGSEKGGRTTIADSGWIACDFTAIQFIAQENGGSLTGAPLQDYWNIWIAEEEKDLLTAPGSSFTAGLVFDPASGLYTSADAASFSPPRPVFIIDSGAQSPPVSEGPLNPGSPYDKLFGILTFVTTAAFPNGVEVDFTFSTKTIKLFGPPQTASGTFQYTFFWGSSGPNATYTVPGTPGTNSNITVPAQVGLSTAEIVIWKDF